MLRRIELADVDLIAGWLSVPEVSRWYLEGSTVADEVEGLHRCASGIEPTEVLMVVDSEVPIGWCQWYLCRDYPDHAAGVGAEAGDVGIDYAIGDPVRHGKGVGTELVATLVAHIRQRHPDAGVIADPQAANIGSRRVLEKNGFRLRGVRSVASERTPSPMAIYRLEPANRPR